MQLKWIFMLVVTIAASVFVYKFKDYKVVSLSSSRISMSAFGYLYDQKPFSGLIYQKRAGFGLSRLLSIKEGLRHGFDYQWYDNGQMFIERHYVGGFEDGEHKAWYEDGSVRSYKVFKNGLANGDFFEWHSNGKLAQYIRYKDGTELAAKSWTSGGKPFYNYVWKQEETVGIRGDRFCSPPKKRL